MTETLTASIDLVEQPTSLELSPAPLPEADPQSLAAFEAALAELIPVDPSTVSSPEASLEIAQTEAVPETPTQTERISRSKRIAGRLGRGALVRTGLEVVGIGVDAALLGAGNAGVYGLQSAFAREAVATAPEIGVINKLSPVHEHHKSARWYKKAGEIALGVTVAGIAQKSGIAIAEHADLAGVAGFTLPLATKLGAISGVTAARRRVAALRAR